MTLKQHPEPGSTSVHVDQDPGVISLGESGSETMLFCVPGLGDSGIEAWVG